MSNKLLPYHITSRLTKHHDGYNKYDVSGREEFGGLALLFMIVIGVCLDINSRPTCASF